MRNDRRRFLSRLTEEQLRALHAELEGLDRAQEGLPDDTTPSMVVLLEEVWAQDAVRTDDPEGYLAAAKTHHEAFRKHYPQWHGTTVKELLLHASADGPEWKEAKRLAELEAPDPSSLADKPKVQDEVAQALKSQLRLSEQACRKPLCNWPNQTAEICAFHKPTNACRK